MGHTEQSARGLRLRRKIAEFSLERRCQECGESKLVVIRLIDESTGEKFIKIECTGCQAVLVEESADPPVVSYII